MNARSLRPRVRFAGILAAAMLLGIAPLVQAAPGDLDPLFGSGGKVTTDFAGSLDYGTALALDSAGRLVVAGYSGPVGSADFAVARYNPDGSLDASFSGDGKVTTDFGGTNDLGLGVAIDAAGRILVAGRLGSTYPEFDIGVVRYDPDGTLNTDFSGDGKVITDFAGAYRARQRSCWITPRASSSSDRQISREFTAQ